MTAMMYTNDSIIRRISLNCFSTILLSLVLWPSVILRVEAFQPQRWYSTTLVRRRQPSTAIFLANGRGSGDKEVISVNEKKEKDMKEQNNDKIPEKQIENASVEETENDEVPSWVKAILEWPLREQQQQRDQQQQSQPNLSPRATNEWLLGPVQDHEAVWLDEIVGPSSNVASTGATNNNATIPLQPTRNTSSSFLNPLISLINLEADSSTATTPSSSSSSTLNQIKSPFDIPIGPNMEDWSALEELLGWDQWVGGLRQSVTDLTSDTTKSAETVLKSATLRIEEIIQDSVTILTPRALQALIGKARGAIPSNLADVAVNASSISSSTSTVGIDAQKTTTTTSFAASLVSVADRAIRGGYVSSSSSSTTTTSPTTTTDEETQALFSDFATAQEIKTYSPYLQSVADMGALAGAVYEDTLDRCHKLDHSLSAKGYSANVLWMVTESTMPASAFNDRVSTKPSATSSSSAADKQQQEFLYVRTITVRGFDASDEEVDRETLLNDVCAADPVESGLSSKVLMHGGLLRLAQEIYKDVKRYIEWSAPSQKIVFCGHSIGGSLSTLLLLLLTEEYGANFVEKKVLRVFSYGSPPVARLSSEASQLPEGNMVCNILTRFGLPTTMVHGFTQPWDPIVRLFTAIDPLYPLAEDLGVDGMTPYNDGPPRTLRPITKKIFEAWEGWPRFRETFKGQSNQEYTSIGVLHVILPEPTRFLVDRFVAVNIPVPQVETLLRLSASEHLPALSAIFPLDTFEISFVPQAIRSFVHHFYPAYDEPIVSFVKRRKQKKTKVVEEPTATTTTSAASRTAPTRIKTNGIKSTAV